MLYLPISYLHLEASKNLQSGDIFALTGAGANPRADGGYVHGDGPAADGVPEALRGHQGPPGHPQATVFFLNTHSLGLILECPP